MPDEDPGDGEDLDPRVEGALGELNAATDDINSNEKLLEETKGKFKTAMAKIQVDLRALANKCGRKAIEKARPYHEALFQARKAHYEARQAAIDYDKGGEAQRRSKAMVTKFEAELSKEGSFNEALQLRLNQATQAVMEADARMRRCSKIHGIKTQAFLHADQELMSLAKSRRKVILKSQPYFACKERHDRALLGIKREIQKHEAGVADSKARVAGALKLLETISTEIHEAREAKKREAEGEADGRKSDEAHASALESKIAEAQADTARREKEESERQVQEKAEKEAAVDNEEVLLTDLPESETAHVIDDVVADAGSNDATAEVTAENAGATEAGGNVNVEPEDIPPPSPDGLRAVQDYASMPDSTAAAETPVSQAVEVPAMADTVDAAVAASLETTVDPNGGGNADAIGESLEDLSLAAADEAGTGGTGTDATQASPPTEIADATESTQ